MTPEQGRRWQTLLLVPQPPLSVLYLLLVRAERLRPSFVPIAALALLPLASLLLAVPRRGERVAGSAASLGLIALAVLELGFAAACAALVGFAIAARSG